MENENSQTVQKTDSLDDSLKQELRHLLVDGQLYPGTVKKISEERIVHNGKAFLVKKEILITVIKE